MNGIRFLDKLANNLIGGREKEAEQLSRRLWLQNFGLISASSAVLWACGDGDDDKDKATADETSDLDPSGDADILKVAIGLENEAIALYTAAAGLDIWDGDLNQTVLAIAAEFLAHHKLHLSTLETGLANLQTIDDSITDADAASTSEEYVTAATDAGADLSTVQGVLRLACGKEGAAAKAYGGVATQFTSEDLAKFSVEHAGDEAAHYGVLRATLFAVLKDTDYVADATKVVPSHVLSGFTSDIS